MSGASRLIRKLNMKNLQCAWSALQPSSLLSLFCATYKVAGLSGEGTNCYTRRQKDQIIDTCVELCILSSVYYTNLRRESFLAFPFN